MKKMLFIMIAVAVCLTASVKAADKIGATADVTYMTNYMWHGIDVLDNMGAFAPSVNFNLGDSGFYTGVKYISPLGSGNAYGIYPLSDMHEWDYWAGYKNQAMVGEATQLDYDMSYTLYDLGSIGRGVNWSGADGDVQELALAVKMPNLLPICVYPRYKAAYLFDVDGGERDIFGFEHTVGLGYDFFVADLPMNAGLDFVYDDGAVYDQHDWSRMVAGLSTAIEMGPGKLVPGVYFQKAFDDSSTGDSSLIGCDDEFWATVSYSIDF